jgi:chemotaxis protein methyltransferase CheR
MLMLHEVVSVEVVRHFCHIATRRLGIGIDAKVEALVAGRVAKRLKVLQLPLDEYLSRLEGDQNCDEVVGFLEVMRPRPARFFARAGEHALLRAHLELCLAAGRRRFRLWSAGCGSGEEPYAMGLTILQAIEAARLAPGTVDWKILASDASLRALERGKNGVFDEEQISGIPDDLVARFFTETNEGTEIRGEVKAHVVFRRLNIAQPPFPMTGPLDAIFCREGLLPLLPRVRRRVIDAAKALLTRDGVLCTGFDEGSLHATDDAEDAFWQEVARDLSLREGNC